jgi:hypothetical protein
MEKPACSFCGKTQDDGIKVLFGDDFTPAICDQCVEMFHKALTENAEGL